MNVDAISRLISSRLDEPEACYLFLIFAIVREIGAKIGTGLTIDLLSKNA